jgi:hypothetical protein
MVQAAFDVRQDALEPHLAAGRRALVIDLHERGVRIGVDRVRIQEARVVSAQLAHGGSIGKRATGPVGGRLGAAARLKYPLPGGQVFHKLLGWE